MSAGFWVPALIILATVTLYLIGGVLTARHESRHLYSVNVRYVRRYMRPGDRDTEPLSEDERARVFREVRKDQREIIAVWPLAAAQSLATWNRNRRKAKLGAAGGWMLAGARAADTELTDARAALEVWRHEHDTEDGLRAETAARMIETTRATIARLEGRPR